MYLTADQQEIIMAQKTTSPTNMAAAFINATVNKMKTEKVDHQTGKGNWIARRVVLNAENPKFHAERGGFTKV